MNADQLFQNKKIKLANELKGAGLYPFFRKIEDTDGSAVTYGKKRHVMIGSNNYLGLTHHPFVIEQAKKAIERYGTGCTGSRFLNGNLEIHEELEEKLAAYMGKEKALVFATGMQVNLGSISALCGPKDCILSDMENHASIIDATRLALGTKFKFKHNDMEDLERQLEEARKNFNQIFIVADGVFSMTGKLFNVQKAAKLAKKYNAWLYIDDAHGLGVMGERGRGTCNYYGVTDQVDLIMGTFSKSFATVGGVIAADADVIDYIKHNARSFMFSAAMAPSSVATASACVDVALKEQSIFDSLWRNVAFMKKGLNDLGFYTYNSQTPIIPVLIGDDIKAMQVTKFLEDNGVFATPVISPAVPQGEALIRTSYMASHKIEDLQYCLDVFAKVQKYFELPKAVDVEQLVIAKSVSSKLGEQCLSKS